VVGLRASAQQVAGAVHPFSSAAGWSIKQMNPLERDVSLLWMSRKMVLPSSIYYYLI
jgi:hypothetical protein